MDWYGNISFNVCILHSTDRKQLSRAEGTFIQPFMAGVNCTLWVAYGLFKEKRDWPLAIANTPGIIFGFVAAFTAL